MLLLQRVGGYQQHFASPFESTNDTCPSFISGSPNYLVSSSARVAGEPAADPSCSNYSFDIREQQIIARHLFKEMRNRELIFAIPYLLPNNINGSQCLSPDSSQNNDFADYWFANTVCPQRCLEPSLVQVQLRRKRNCFYQSQPLIPRRICSYHHLPLNIDVYAFQA